MNIPTGDKFLKISQTDILTEKVKHDVKLDVEKKADKVQNATSGNLASLDASGNLEDSGKNVQYFASASDLHDVSVTVEHFDTSIREIANCVSVLSNDINDVSVHVDSSIIVIDNSISVLSTDINDVSVRLSNIPSLTPGDNISIANSKINALGYTYNNSIHSIADGPAGLNTANGLYSHSEGYWTTAGSFCQHVEGKYNVIDNDEQYVKIIGNGSDSARSNAYTMSWNGDSSQSGNISFVYNNSHINLGSKLSQLDSSINGTAHDASFYMNDSTYIINLQLKDENGNNVGSLKTIDLPLEAMITNGRYESSTKELVLTLKNENEIRISIADIVTGLVSTTQYNSDKSILDTSISTINTRIGSIDSSISTLSTTVGTHTSSINNINTHLSTTDGSLSTITTQLDSISTQVTVIDTSLDDLYTDVSNMDYAVSNAINELNNTLSDHSSIISDLDTSVREFGARISNVESSVSGLNTRVGNTESSISGLNTRVGNVESSVSGLNTRIGNVESSVSGLNTRMTTIDSSLSIIDTSLTQAISDIDDMDYTISRAINHLESDKVNTALMKQQLYLSNINWPKFDVFTTIKWDTTTHQWIAGSDSKWFNSKMYYDREDSSLLVDTFVTGSYVVFKYIAKNTGKFKITLCQDWDWTDGIDDHGIMCPSWYIYGSSSMEWGYNTDWIKTISRQHMWDYNGNIAIGDLANDNGFIYVTWNGNFITDSQGHRYPKIRITCQSQSEGYSNPFTN